MSPEWINLRGKAMSLLQKESELQEIVQLVGADALPDRERAVLEGARVIREDFLQQHAYHKVDTYCSEHKQFKMLEVMLKFYDACLDAVNEGLPARELAELAVLEDIARLKYVPNEEFDAKVTEIEKKMGDQLKAASQEKD